MSIVVKKFGGTSVESIEKISKIAKHLASEKQKGDGIVVVVSAMGKTTDSLFSLAYEITKTPNQREMDMLLTAGERVTMALLSLSLQKLDIQSISFTGSQSGIITNNSHGNAKIMTINAFRIFKELSKGKIVIVAGFQGVSYEKEITTLGRGGSDTTAVALASFLKAKKCEIFTDVDGVYQVDPKIVSSYLCNHDIQKFKKMDNLSYEEMLYMSLTGSKILHSRATEFAYKYAIPIEIKSSIDYKGGTMIGNETEINTSENEFIEKPIIKTISCKENVILFKTNITNTTLPPFQTEIFDWEIFTPESKLADSASAIFYIEKKYKEKFINELHDFEITFSFEDKEYAIINILGYRINRDIDFLRNLYSNIKNSCKESLSIKNQGIGVQVVIVQNDAANVLQCIGECLTS